MAQPQIKIVHESEVQRQHVRLQIPCRVEIEGQTYRVSDLSSGGLCVEGYAHQKQVGQTLPIILALPFDDFTLDLALKAEVQHCRHTEKILGCRFAEVSTSQLSVLNHVIKAFIAGDMLSAGDVLAVASRDNFVKMRQNKPGIAPEDRATKIKRYIGLSVIALLAACALFFVVGNIFQSAFVLKTTEARVVAQQIVLRMPVSGTFSSALTVDTKRLQKGQLVGTIDSSVKVLSPCDCLVEANSIIDGSYQAEGVELMKLILATSAPVIEANFSMQDIQKIDMGDAAAVMIAGSDVVLEAEVSAIKTQASLPSATSNSLLIGTIILKTKQALPPELSGRPASISIRM